MSERKHGTPVAPQRPQNPPGDDSPTSQIPKVVAEHDARVKPGRTPNGSARPQQPAQNGQAQNAQAQNGQAQNGQAQGRTATATPTAPLAGTHTAPQQAPAPSRHEQRKAEREAKARTKAERDEAEKALAAKAAAKVETVKPEKPEPRPTSDANVRKARLRLVHLDPWSVMKTAFALSLALAIVTVVAVTIVWSVLGAAGVWDAINSTVSTVLSDNENAFDITKYVGFGRIIGMTIVISAIDVVLITALATIGAFLYNLASGLLGGVEITLAEEN